MSRSGADVRRWSSAALAAALPTLLVLAGLEAAIRGAYWLRNESLDRILLPYVLGHEYGPLPPWVDGVRILVPDETLIWRGRPHARNVYVDVFGPAPDVAARTRLLHQFLPRVPEALRDRPTWEIALNGEGFRDDELPEGRDPERLRVLCLGDSWTFGANVGPADGFPRRLEGLLEERGIHADVLNLGVLGYSSYQGLALLRSRALALEPDAVVIGFAMNDSSVPGYRDRDVLAEVREPSLGSRLGKVLERIELIRLLRYALERVGYAPTPMQERLVSAQEAADRREESADYSEMEAWTRVSPSDYEANLRIMIELVREAGARAVLVYNEFETETPYRRVQAQLSEELGVPFVDSSALLAEARRRIEREASESRGLRAPGSRAPLEGERTEVVFRVFAADVPEALYLAGAHPALEIEPNTLRLHDDGSHGDERAEDGVWSLAVAVEPGARLVYTYTNSGAPGRWEGLDVPAFRSLVVESDAAGERVYRPVESFGELVLHADAWHPDARGYARIARAVAAALSSVAGPISQ